MVRGLGFPVASTLVCAATALSCGATTEEGTDAGRRGSDAAVARFSLTVKITGFGDVEVSPPGPSYAARTRVSLKATPRTGHRFSGWTGDLKGDEPSAALVMNSHQTVEAEFAAVPGGRAPQAQDAGRDGPSPPGEQPGRSGP